MTDSSDTYLILRVTYLRTTTSTDLHLETTDVPTLFFELFLCGGGLQKPATPKLPSTFLSQGADVKSTLSNLLCPERVVSKTPYFSLKIKFSISADDLYFILYDITVETADNTGSCEFERSRLKPIIIINYQ